MSETATIRHIMAKHQHVTACSVRGGCTVLVGPMMAIDDFGFSAYSINVLYVYWSRIGSGV